jgi:hypothetical protein
MNSGLSQEEIEDFLSENNLTRMVTAKEIAQKCTQIVQEDKSGQIYEIFGEK